MITAFSFALTNFMSITLFQEIDTINPLEYLSIPGSFFVGICVSRAIMLSLILREKDCCGFIVKTLKFWDFKIFETLLAYEKEHALENYN